MKKMASILERTDSAYFPCFRNLFDNVVTSMTEAKEISLYLSPLAKSFKAVEEVDFSEAKPLMATLIHSVGLAWSKSTYYQSSSKVIIMLRQICNLLIQEARRFLDPSSIFQSDVDEALQRVQISRGGRRRHPCCLLGNRSFPGRIRYQFPDLVNSGEQRGREDGSPGRIQTF